MLDGKTDSHDGFSGVFDTASGRTLFLFVDFKSDGVLYALLSPTSQKFHS